MNPQPTLESVDLLEGQNQVLELIAGGAPLRDVLDLLLRVIQAKCPGMLGSILLLDSDGVHVRHGASPDLPEAFTRAIDGAAIGPQAGSCGTAAFRREQVVVEDIATDPLWDNYRDFALKCGLRACWSTPIFDVEHRVLGTFAMYFRTPGRPDPRDLRLIEISTHIAAIAIAKHQRTEALHSSEERLRLALSGNVDIWEWDLSTQHLWWRGQLGAIFGWRGEVGNLPLNSVLAAIAPEDRSHVETVLQASLAQGISHELEYRVVPLDGSQRWIASRGRPEYDSSGKAVRLTGVAMEITERKLVEEALKRHQAQLLEAQRIARLGSYEWDLRTFSVHRSEELCRIFGVLPHEFEPTFEGYLARVHPDDRSRTKEIVETAFREQRPFDFEERIVLPDGTIRVLHSQGQWTFDDVHNPVKLVGICLDITERKQVEQQLRAVNTALAGELKERTRAEKEIQALTARLIGAQEEERTRIARELHDDLGQQIATLSIAASNLKKDIRPEDSEARAQSGRIQQKLIQLAEGVRQLSHNLHPAVLEYSGLAAALESYCSEFTTLTGVTVLFKTEGSFDRLPQPVALCLYRIAQEALQNVLKHARVRQAELGITASAQSVSLTVSDRGVGIDTLRASTHQGLGLVNIKERTRLVNGTLSIESKPDRGTTLNVMVPISDRRVDGNP